MYSAKIQDIITIMASILAVKITKILILPLCNQPTWSDDISLRSSIKSKQNYKEVWCIYRTAHYRYSNLKFPQIPPKNKWWNSIRLPQWHLKTYLVPFWKLTDLEPWRCWSVCFAGQGIQYEHLELLRKIRMDQIKCLPKCKKISNILGLFASI